MANTVKIALDFMSPFNSHQYEKNIDRIRMEENREDYMGIWRTLHKGLTKALKILNSAEEQENERQRWREEMEHVSVKWYEY